MEKVTLEQAIQLMLESIETIDETEQVNLIKALGRISAVDILASMDNPPFDRSPIDGYACKFLDVEYASNDNPVKLKVIGEVCAGQFSKVTVNEGQAVRIMTGGAIPDGCDCCVWQESTDYGEDEVLVYSPSGEYENYCFAGEDYKSGTKLVEAGTKLNYIDIGILASDGHESINVYRKPKIALITTGDEVVNPGEILKPGCIYNSNKYLIESRLIELGYGAVIVEDAKDDPKDVAEKIKTAFETADIVITTGGVSVGKKDILHQSIELLGAQRVFWKIKIKPGMPTMYSVYNGKPIVSLSGNPFGAAANFELLIRPLIAKMSHDYSVSPQRLCAVISDDFKKDSSRRRFVRALYREGTVYVPGGLHTSGALGSLKGCNCLIDVKAGSDAIKRGELVDIVLID